MHGGRRRRGRGIRTVLAMAVLLTADSVSGSQLEELAVRAGVATIAQGTSDKAAEDGARASLPLRRMTPANRARALRVLKNTSQYRRLPQVTYAVDRPLYHYLVQHPDVAVSTWRALGISEFRMWQTGPLEYEAESGDGSEGIADILYRDAGCCVFICEGRYQNALLPKAISASVLVSFQYRFGVDAHGTETVTQIADVFVMFPSQSVAAVAQVLSPVTNSLLDRNLYEVTLYASMMSRAVREEPGWIVHLSQQLDGVLPSRPEELRSIARLPRKPRRVTHRRVPPEIDSDQLVTYGIRFFAPPAPVRSAEATRDSEGATAAGKPESSDSGAGPVLRFISGHGRTEPPHTPPSVPERGAVRDDGIPSPPAGHR